MLPAAAGIVCGIVLGNCGATLATVIVGLTAFGLLYALGRHYLSFFALMAAIGAILFYAHKPDPLPEPYLGTKTEFMGRICSVVDTDVGERCVVKIYNCDGSEITPAKALVFISGYHPEICPGQSIAFEATLRPIHEDTEVPHALNYEKHLPYQYITATGFAPAASLRVLSQPAWYWRAINGARSALYNAIVSSPISGHTAAFLLATLLGDDVYISADASAQYRMLGISHILAISGMHVAIIVSLLSFIFLPLRLMPHGVSLQRWLTIILVWAYAIVCGLSPSVSRAAVMVTVLLLASMLQQGYKPLNSLCVAATLILAFNPLSLFTPGFQLSFAAVISIMIFARIVPDRWRRRPWLFFIANSAVLPIAAMLGTGLISAYYFNSFPLSFFVSNIVVGALFPWILGGGAVLSLFSLIGIGFVPLGWCIDRLFDFMTFVVGAISDSMGWQLQGIYFSAWAFVPYAAAIAMLALAVRHLHRRRVARSYALCALSSFIVCGTVIAYGGEKIPLSEFYIPSDKPSAMILRHGSNAWIIPFSDSAETLRHFNRKYQGYLLSRKCPAQFDLCPDSLQLGPFYRRGAFLANGSDTYLIVDSVLNEATTHIDKAVITPAYLGSMADVVEAAHPDTVIFVRGISPSRKRRFMRQCADTIPYISL